MKMKIAILNTSILTSEGVFSLREITLGQAQKLVREKKILSAVGHQSTADILTELLEIPVPVNRINFQQQPGQKAVVFKLNGRPEEGKILNRAEIESIGYKFQLLERERDREIFHASCACSSWEIIRKDYMDEYGCMPEFCPSCGNKVPWERRKYNE